FHGRMSLWLGTYVIATPGTRLFPTTTWVMTEDDVPQPDIALVIDPHRGGQSRKEGIYSAGAPELVVEVSVTTTAKDAGAKLRLYERMGVREYLIAKPKKRELVWRVLTKGKYRLLRPDSKGLLRSHVFPGLWLNPELLWNDDSAALSALIQQGT